jgi:hypothetical protein
VLVEEKDIVSHIHDLVLSSQCLKSCAYDNHFGLLHYCSVKILIIHVMKLSKNGDLSKSLGIVCLCILPASSLP